MASPQSSALYLVNLIFLLSLFTFTILVSHVDAHRLGKTAAMEGVGETKPAGDEYGRKMVGYYLRTTHNAAEKNLGDMKNLPPFPLFPFPPIPQIPFPPPLVIPGVPPLPPFPMFPPLPPFHIPTIPFFTPPPP